MTQSDTTPRLLRPTVSGWIAVIIIVACLVVVIWSWLDHGPAAIALGALAMALMVALDIAWIMAPRSLRSIEAHWSAPKTVSAWEPFGIAAEISAATSRPPLVLEVDPPDQRGSTPIGGIPGLGREPSRVVWTMTCRRRGPTLIPPLLANTTHPFGFWHCRRPIGGSVEVLVLPYIGTLHHDLLAKLQELDEEDWASTEQGDDDLAYLRDYRPGDPRHSIHWKASARLRSLVTIVRHSVRRHQLSLVIDCAVSRQPSQRFEKLIATAATIVDRLKRLDWTVTLYGAFTEVGEGIGGQYGDLMCTLATLEAVPDTDVTDYIPECGPCLVLSLEPRELPPRRQRPMQIAVADIDRYVRLRSRLC